MNKKTCQWDDKPTRPKTPETPSSEMVSSDTPWQDGRVPEVTPTEVSQRPTGPRSASSTQTVSQLGESVKATPLPQVINKLRLAQLEREAQQLRRLLGLEATTTSQGTMTTSDLDQPDGPQAAAAVVKSSTEVVCQTDTAEVGPHVVFAWIQVYWC